MRQKPCPLLPRPISAASSSIVLLAVSGRERFPRYFVLLMPPALTFPSLSRDRRAAHVRARAMFVEYPHPSPVAEKVAGLFIATYGYGER
jgi:hypothetical protein